MNTEMVTCEGSNRDGSDCQHSARFILLVGSKYIGNTEEIYFCGRHSRNFRNSAFLVPVGSLKHLAA